MPNFNKNQTNIISLIAKIVDPSVFQYHNRGFCHGLVVANFILSNCFHIDFFEILAEIDNYKQQNPTGEPPEEIIKKIDMVKTAFSIICGTQLPFCSSTIGNLQQIGREISQFKCKENVHAVGKMLGNQLMLSFDFLPIESPPLTTYDELNSTLTFLLEKITTEQVLQLYISERGYHSISIRSTKTTPPIFYLYDPNNKDGEESFLSIDDLIKALFCKTYGILSAREYSKFKNGTTRISCLFNLFSTTEINDSEILAKKRKPTANITPASFQYKGVNGENLLHTLVFGGLTEEEWKEILNNPDAKSLINAQDVKGDTPLHYACIFNNSIAMKVLLEAGANVNIFNKKGLNPFGCAVYGCAYDVLKTLYEQNKIQSILDCLRETQPNVDVDLFKKCIFDAGNNLRSRENIDWVAANVALTNKLFLFDLVCLGKISILKQLALAYPEKISQLLRLAKDECGNNALMYAAFEERNLEIVKWLVENNEVPLTEKNNKGDTALRIASRYKNPKIETYLKAVCFLKNNIPMSQKFFHSVNLAGINLSAFNIDFSNAHLSGVNLSGACLVGACLVGANLSEADLIGANLIGANLSNVDLRRSNLCEAKLGGVKLKGAIFDRTTFKSFNIPQIKETNFKEAIFTGDFGEIDFKGADLRGVDLSGADLNWANLGGVNLSGENLSGANLSGANLSGANLTGTDLSGARLVGANLTGTDLSKTNLSGVDLRGSNLCEAKLGGVGLKGVIFDRTTFESFNIPQIKETNFKEAIFIGNFRRIDFKGADLRGVDLSRADLNWANLGGVNLSGENLSGADLRGADLRGADLRGANLRGANLSGADLRGANLSGANLIGVNLSGENLMGADLRGANLRKANLSGANLSEANLSGANLSGANLGEANLNGADLSNSNLRGANLSYYCLRGANLSGALLYEQTLALLGFLNSLPNKQKERIKVFKKDEDDGFSLEDEDEDEDAEYTVVNPT